MSFSLITFAKEIPRANRWEGSVRSCLGNATAQERIKYGSKLPRHCTCLANFFVETCAPNDKTTSKEFSSCALKQGNDYLKETKNCLKAGLEPDQNPYL